MLHSSLEMDTTLKGIKVIAKNSPVLKNANTRGLAELWKSWGELRTDLLPPC